MIFLLFINPRGSRGSCRLTVVVIQVLVVVHGNDGSEGSRAVSGDSAGSFMVVVVVIKEAVMLV